MGLIHARPFIRTVVEDVTSLEEHTDAFSINNIPDNLLDDTYHIAPGSFPVNERFNQTGNSINYATVLRIFKVGDINDDQQWDTSAAIDTVTAIAEPLLQALLDPQRRTDNVKQVLYNDMRFVDLTTEADHIVVCEIDLDIQVILCANNT